MADQLVRGGGQKTAADSMPVVIASDQPAIPVSITGAGVDLTVDIDSSNLATAAGQALQATAAKQDTAQTTLTAIDGHVDGLETSASSIDTKLSSQATAAKQDTGNTSVASIDAKISAAVAPGDAMDNATTMGALRARLQAFNGTTWDRLRSGITTVGNAITGFTNNIPWAFFNTTPTTRTTGQGGPFEADALGNLRMTEQAPPAYECVADAVAASHDKPAASAAFNAIPYDNITLAAAGVIKAAPGNLYRLYVTHTNAAAQYYALVNKATTPANGDTPIMYFRCGIGETKLIEFKFGKRFTTGIGWAQVTGIAATITLSAAESVANAECS